MTILLVEDEPLIRMALSEFLESHGHVCAHASTVQGALAIAETQSFNAALLDIVLKDEKVYPVVRALQQKGVHCIFFTGHLAEHLPVEFADLPCLEKPFDEAAVIDAISACTG